MKRELYLLVVLIALSFVFYSFNPKFFSLENIFDMLRNNAFLGIMVLGELVVLISGGIDVSLTAIATVAQYTMGVLLVRNYLNNILITMLIPVIVGLALGFINAIFIYYTRVHPVIVTISTLNIFYGLLIFLTQGKWLYRFPSFFRKFSKINILTLVNQRGVPYGLSIFVILWFLLALLTWVILSRFSIGRKIYALGGNQEAARRAGFSIFRIYVFTYGYAGALAGFASFVQAQLSQIIQPNAIVGRELDILAAAILGGASIFGGSGTVLGVVLGTILIAIIRNGLILMKISSYWHELVIGVIFVAAASIVLLRRRQKRRKVMYQ